MGILGTIGTIAGSFFGGAAGGAIGKTFGDVLDGATKEKKASAQQPQCAPAPKGGDVACEKGGGGIAELLTEVRQITAQLSKLVESLSKGYGQQGGACGGKGGGDSKYDDIIGQLKGLISNLKQGGGQGGGECRPMPCPHQPKPPVCSQPPQPRPCPPHREVPCRPIHIGLPRPMPMPHCGGNEWLFRGPICAR